MLVSTICTGAINKLCSGLTEIFGVFFFSDEYIDTITDRKYGNTASIKKRKKRADVDGWCPSTVNTRPKNKGTIKLIGDWRRDTLVQNLQYKLATVKWTQVPTMKMFSLPTPVPVGMERLLMKLENAQNRSYPVIPIAVREEFSMTDSAYRSEDYTVNASFSKPKYDNYRLLYCHICITYCCICTSVPEQFWDKYPEKLPKD